MKRRRVKAEAKPRHIRKAGGKKRLTSSKKLKVKA